MEKLQIRGRWDDVKKKIQSNYPTITDNDLKYEFGREEELLRKLSAKTGKSEQELIAWINQLSPTAR